MTKREISKAIKRVERAIDAMIDIQDMGLGTEAEARILERLNQRKGQLLGEYPSN